MRMPLYRDMLIKKVQLEVSEQACQPVGLSTNERAFCGSLSAAHRAPVREH
jgi:hypothetical protein